MENKERLRLIPQQTKSQQHTTSNPSSVAPPPYQPQKMNGLCSHHSPRVPPIQNRLVRTRKPSPPNPSRHIPQRPPRPKNPVAGQSATNLWPSWPQQGPAPAAGTTHAVVNCDKHTLDPHSNPDHKTVVCERWHVGSSSRRACLPRDQRCPLH